MNESPIEIKTSSNRKIVAGQNILVLELKVKDEKEDFEFLVAVPESTIINALNFFIDSDGIKSNDMKREYISNLFNKSCMMVVVNRKSELLIPVK